MINDDVLPTDHQARHIAVALHVLRLGGIDVALEVQPDGAHPFAVVFKSTTAEGSEHLRQSVQLALEYEWQTTAAALAVLQAKGARPC